MDRPSGEAAPAAVDPRRRRSTSRNGRVQAEGESVVTDQRMPEHLPASHMTVRSCLWILMVQLFNESGANLQAFSSWVLSEWSILEKSVDLSSELFIDDPSFWNWPRPRILFSEQCQQCTPKVSRMMSHDATRAALRKCSVFFRCSRVVSDMAETRFHTFDGPNPSKFLVRSWSQTPSILTLWWSRIWNIRISEWLKSCITFHANPTVAIFPTNTGTDFSDWRNASFCEAEWGGTDRAHAIGRAGYGGQCCGAIDLMRGLLNTKDTGNMGWIWGETDFFRGGGDANLRWLESCCGDGSDMFWFWFTLFWSVGQLWWYGYGWVLEGHVHKNSPMK